ncbi:MAG: DEAD/DEAH box helicase [Candidatus Woesearchaeota archaeon]|jgi:ATP-dependent RNA helicase DeaD
MNFEELNLAPQLLKAVQYQGYTEPTDIQQKTIPLILDGKDIVGQSATGSGKTAAFGLPILGKIKPGQGLQFIVLTPTRELCVQVAETLTALSKFMPMNIVKIYGGVGMGPQVDAARYADIVVGTPGRTLDHLNHNTLNLSKVKFLVIDEADKMFEMGFIEDVEQILSYIPSPRQTLLFSATMSDVVLKLVERHLNHPVNIRTVMHVDRSLLKQVYYNVDQREKFSLLLHCLKNKTPGLALVFCATRQEVDLLNRNLKMQGIKVMAIHGGLTQNKREYALKQLRDENIDVLVATDVAARGLDIKNVSNVYNYDAPKTSEEYVHRIGRTARAGEKGEAVTLLSQRDFDNFRRIESDRTLQIKEESLPEYEKVRFVREVERRGGRFGGGDHFGNRGPQHGGVATSAYGSRSNQGPREGGFNRGSRSEEGASRGGAGGFHRGPRPEGSGGFHRGPRPEGSGGFNRGPRSESGARPERRSREMTRR